MPWNDCEDGTFRIARDDGVRSFTEHVVSAGKGDYFKGLRKLSCVGYFNEKTGKVHIIDGGHRKKSMIDQ